MKSTVFCALFSLTSLGIQAQSPYFLDRPLTEEEVQQRIADFADSSSKMRMMRILDHDQKWRELNCRIMNRFRVRHALPGLLVIFREGRQDVTEVRVVNQRFRRNTGVLDIEVGYANGTSTVSRCMARYSDIGRLSSLAINARCVDGIRFGMGLHSESWWWREIIGAYEEDKQCNRPLTQAEMNFLDTEALE